MHLPEDVSTEGRAFSSIACRAVLRRNGIFIATASSYVQKACRVSWFAFEGIVTGTAGKPNCTDLQTYLSEVHNVAQCFVGIVLKLCYLQAYQILIAPWYAASAAYVLKGEATEATALQRTNAKVLSKAKLVEPHHRCLPGH